MEDSNPYNNYFKKNKNKPYLKKLKRDSSKSVTSKKRNKLKYNRRDGTNALLELSRTEA